MAFACSCLIRCIYKLFFVAVVISTYVSCQFPPGAFRVATLGSSYNITCPGDERKHHTFTFFRKNGFRTKKEKIGIDIDDRFKQDKSILIIIQVQLGDGGTYSCVVRDQTGHLLSRQNLGILFLIKAKKYHFAIHPKLLSCLVNEGDRFEFRCEYGKPKTKIIWWRLNERASNIKIEIPRENISVKIDATKSVESYVIMKVAVGDSGAYRCEVMENGKPKFTDAHVLQVIKNKKPHFSLVEKVFNVKEEKRNFEIDLKLQGAPFPNITCSREGKEVISCSGNKMTEAQIYGNSCKRDNFKISVEPALIIPQVYYSAHHGNYCCVATNIVGSANVTFTVNVTGSRGGS